MNRKKKALINVILALVVINSFLIGCVDQGPLFTASLDLIEPDLGDFGVELQIINFTYEVDYREGKDETSPIYDIVVPEYLFIRYIGVGGERRSLNFFAFKVDSIDEGRTLFDDYTENLLLNGVELESYERIGNESFMCEVDFHGLRGYGLEFRIANVVVVLVGFSVEEPVFLNAGNAIEQNIIELMN